MKLSFSSVGQDNSKLQQQISMLVTLTEMATLVKISNLLICFCSFDLSCPILEQNNFTEYLYIVLSY